MVADCYRPEHDAAGVGAATNASLSAVPTDTTQTVLLTPGAGATGTFIAWAPRLTSTYHVTLEVRTSEGTATPTAQTQVLVGDFGSASFATASLDRTATGNTLSYQGDRFFPGGPEGGLIIVAVAPST